MHRNKDIGISKEEFYQEAFDFVRGLNEKYPRDEWWHLSAYMQDSKFYGELGINANDIYIFEGEKVYGHELNYFFQGLIYKHFNMVKEDTWRLRTYWKAYNATADYLYEKINYGIGEKKLLNNETFDFLWSTFFRTRHTKKKLWNKRTT